VEAELRTIGVIGYLRKPFSQQDLEEEIERALATTGE
jgi:FixJ family two-component response regulator